MRILGQNPQRNFGVGEISAISDAGRMCATLPCAPRSASRRHSARSVEELNNHRLYLAADRNACTRRDADIPAGVSSGFSTTDRDYTIGTMMMIGVPSISVLLSIPKLGFEPRSWRRTGREVIETARNKKAEKRDRPSGFLKLRLAGCLLVTA